MRGNHTLARYVYNPDLSTFLIQTKGDYKKNVVPKCQTNVFGRPWWTAHIFLYGLQAIQFFIISLFGLKILFKSGLQTHRGHRLSYPSARYQPIKSVLILSIQNFNSHPDFRDWRPLQLVVSEHNILTKQNRAYFCPEVDTDHSILEIKEIIM